ncbi:MAG TPA: trehalose-phosphatase, partial [Thermoanaerobaculia bacterium]|nr:trehalose-phosphatase [Thermoanaerobaculia bacterium]
MTRLLLASDFDGTLAPIREQPEEVAIDPEALQLLREASENPEIVVALISGRDVDDLRRRAGDLRAWYSGSHGHEIVAPDGSKFRAATPWKGVPPRAWLDRATSAGFRVEPKRCGMALHWRGIAGIDHSHPLVLDFEQWAGSEGLTVIRGRCVSEASSGSSSKEEVLRTLAAQTGAEQIVFAGDDLTDFAALGFAASRGRGFLVASEERPERPPAGVETVASREELLRSFASVLAALGVGSRRQSS